MKTRVISIIVLLASIGFAQQVVIRDSAEYNAYITAVNQPDLKAQAEAYEAFLRQYPNSVAKVSALEQLIAAYQKINDIPKLQDAAGRLLQADPVNLKALALLTYSNRMCSAQTGPNAMQCLNDAGKYGQQGLQALKTAQAPAGTTPEDWDKLKQQTAPIFNGAVGMQALQAKNYPQAAEALSVAVAANPNDLQNVYPLALAYLQSPKPNYERGFYFLARAVNLASGSAGQEALDAYGRSQYSKVFGSEQGWDSLLGPNAPVPRASRRSSNDDPTLSDDLPRSIGELTAREIAKHAFRSVVAVIVKGRVPGRNSLGSGFVTRGNLVVTNRHVIEDGVDACVKPIGKACDYHVVGVAGVDYDRDIAVLVIERTLGPGLPLGSSQRLGVGDTIYAVGNPEGLEGTFSSGILSASRVVGSRHLLQITAPISHGSSGGPILDSRGEVIGIAVSTLQAGQNLNFAVPIEDVRGILERLTKPIPLSDIIWPKTRRSQR